jgi:hypothetical protein
MVQHLTAAGGMADMNGVSSRDAQSRSRGRRQGDPYRDRRPAPDAAAGNRPPLYFQIGVSSDLSDNGWRKIGIVNLSSQSRPLRSVHRGEGWSPSTIAEHGMPALKPSFYKLDRSADVFNWDPI